MSKFYESLRPASYRGFRFFVLEGSARFGRRNAVHEYPKRDVPWVEDMGRSARRISVTGYLVGGDVVAQRDKLIALVEKRGDGDLVHPTLGTRRVALMDFTTNEQWSEGRKVEVHFEFIEQGLRQYPKEGVGAATAVADKADAADTSASAAFTRRTRDAAKQGESATAAGFRRGKAFSDRAQRSVDDPARLVRMAVRMPGSFGRMFRRRRGLGQLALSLGMRAAGLPSGVTLASLSSATSASRALVGSSANKMPSSGDPSGIVAAALDLTAQVAAAAPSPGDAVLALLDLAALPPDAPETGAALAVQRATQDALRRTALIAAIRAAMSYSPDSAEDAQALRTTLLVALDAEITLAGDQGEDDVYSDLRQLRAQLVAALNAAGARAPELRDVQTPLPAPSLVLAQRLYRDATRAGDLVERAAPVHPAFMPTYFRAPSA